LQRAVGSIARPRSAGGDEWGEVAAGPAAASTMGRIGLASRSASWAAGRVDLRGPEAIRTGQGVHDGQRLVGRGLAARAAGHGSIRRASQRRW